MVMPENEAADEQPVPDAVDEQVEATEDVDLAPDESTDAGTDEAQVETTPDTVASLEALWERHPHLREEYEREKEAYGRERENAGGNRREAQLKNEAGKRETTRRNVEALFATAGIDPHELVTIGDGRTVQRADYLYLLAEANAAVQIAAEIPEAILHNYRLDPSVRERAIEARERGDIDGYVTAYVTGAVEQETVKRIGEMSLADVPAGSKLRRELDAERQRIRTAETQAARAEAAPRRSAAPPIPQNASPAVKRIFGDEYERAAPDQKQKYRDEHYVLVSANGNEVQLG